MYTEYDVAKWVKHQNQVLAAARQQQQMFLGLHGHIQHHPPCSSVVTVQPSGLDHEFLQHHYHTKDNPCLLTQQYGSVTELLPIYDNYTATCQTDPLYAFSTQNHPSGQLSHLEQPEQAYFPPAQQPAITNQPSDSDRLPCAYLEREMEQYQGGQLQLDNNRLDINDPGMVYTQSSCRVPLGWPTQEQMGPPPYSYDPSRLTHDSWFLSQPYHVGLPQSTHRLPEAQVTPPLHPLFPSHPQANPTSLLPPVSCFHQAVSHVHHKMFESYQLPSGQRKLINNPDHVPIQGLLVSKTRKRTFIDGCRKLILEKEYAKNSRPNEHKIKKIVTKLGGEALVSSKTVKVWFANRRSRTKRANLEAGRDND